MSGALNYGDALVLKYLILLVDSLMALVNKYWMARCIFKKTKSIVEC